MVLVCCDAPQQFYTITSIVNENKFWGKPLLGLAWLICIHMKFAVLLVLFVCFLAIVLCQGVLFIALVNFADASWKQTNAFNYVIPNKRHYELCSSLMHCILHVKCIVPFHIKVVHNYLLTHVYQHQLYDFVIVLLKEKVWI